MERYLALVILFKFLLMQAAMKNIIVGYLCSRNLSGLVDFVVTLGFVVILSLHKKNNCKNNKYALYEPIMHSCILTFIRLSMTIKKLVRVELHPQPPKFRNHRHSFCIYDKIIGDIAESARNPQLVKYFSVSPSKMFHQLKRCKNFFYFDIYETELRGNDVLENFEENAQVSF